MKHLRTGQAVPERGNPFGDKRLNIQESAEVIVVAKCYEGPNH